MPPNNYQKAALCKKEHSIMSCLRIMVRVCTYVTEWNLISENKFIKCRDRIVIMKWLEADANENAQNMMSSKNHCKVNPDRKYLFA